MQWLSTSAIWVLLGQYSEANQFNNWKVKEKKKVLNLSLLKVNLTLAYLD